MPSIQNIAIVWLHFYLEEDGSAVSETVRCLTVGIESASKLKIESVGRDPQTRSSLVRDPQTKSSLVRDPHTRSSLVLF